MKLRLRVLAAIAVFGYSVLSGHSANAAQYQPRYSARDAVDIAKSIKPRMTLRQIKSVLPRGLKYSWDGDTSLGNWTWNVLRFRGFRGGKYSGIKREGVLIFANDRAKYMDLRPSKSKAERARALKAATAWREGDIVHSASVFLGEEVKVRAASAIERDTRRQMNRVIALLGRPARKNYETPGGGPGDEGWNATWKLSRGRELYFAETMSLLDSATRPSLDLRFGYSQIYRA